MNEPSKLVGAEELLEAVFTEKSRPSLSWLRDQIRTRKLPFIKLGRFTYFDVEQVRATIKERHTLGKQK